MSVPCLFVSGTRDSFGTQTELEEATAAIPGPVTHVWIDGGDHGLRGKDAEVARHVRDWFLGL
jgi:predicted alpha/beta-hydrolase family hydrolase